MKTFTELSNLYGTLSQNSSASNIALGSQLMNDRQRYLIQKYFDNERSFQTTTVGAMNLTAYASSATNIASVATDLYSLERFPGGGDGTGESQAFVGVDGLLANVSFYTRFITGTGTVTAKLYTADASYNPDTLLATSDAIDITTLPASLALQQFSFPVAERYLMSAGTVYCITIELSGTGEIGVGGDSSNFVTFYSGKWREESSPGVWTSMGGGNGALVFSVKAYEAIQSGATSGILSEAWAYPTVTQLVNFSNGDQRSTLFTNGSVALSWTGGLTSAVTTSIASVGVQAYAIPAVVSKITNETISVGQLKFVPAPVMSRNEWDRLNTLPYTSQIVNYYFIYNGNVEFFPIPSSTGQIIQFNYKARVPDMNLSDITAGHIADNGMVAGSTAVTGVGTTWVNVSNLPTGVDISYLNLFIRADPPHGDGIWYQIAQCNSDTSLTLSVPVVNAPNITAATTYTIGQMPVLFEDFQDMLVDFALQVYFSTIVKDKDKAALFAGFYKAKEDMMERYLANKQTNVDLGGPIPQMNPNLYWMGN